MSLRDPAVVVEFDVGTSLLDELLLEVERLDARVDALGPLGAHDRLLVGGQLVVVTKGCRRGPESQISTDHWRAATTVTGRA